MSTSARTRGACVFCGKEMTRGGMARHLHACAKRMEAGIAADRSRRQRQSLYHLQVQDTWSGDFWLHLEVRGSATLKTLDDYLRAIWLECCGHLSQFEIGGVAYTQIIADGFGYREEHAMNVAIERLFVPELVIPYEYDFGSTTELTIKVVRVRLGKSLTGHPIYLMARNNFTPPACAECSRPASCASNAGGTSQKGASPSAPNMPRRMSIRR
jgi:hypothetical protein